MCKAGIGCTVQAGLANAADVVAAAAAAAGWSDAAADAATVAAAPAGTKLASKLDDAETSASQQQRHCACIRLPNQKAAAAARSNSSDR